MTVLVVQLVVTLLLTGFIWTIQVLHYPLFAQVGTDAFTAYEASHSARVTWLIVVPWAVQGVTTAIVLLSPPAGVGRGLAVAGAVAAAATVAVTVLVSVPAHSALSDGFDAAAHARLTSTNWLRTAAWTTHAGLALWMLLRHVRAT